MSALLRAYEVCEAADDNMSCKDVLDATALITGIPVNALTIDAAVAGLRVAAAAHAAKAAAVVDLGPGANVLRSAANADLGKGVTAAGRAFQKHSSRATTVFVGKATGKAAENAAQGAAYIDDILARGVNSGPYTHQVYGDVIDIRIPGGAGARWSADGTKFIGFLEP